MFEEWLRLSEKSDEDREFDPHPSPYDSICSFPLFNQIKIHCNHDLVCKRELSKSYMSQKQKHLIEQFKQLKNTECLVPLFSLTMGNNQKNNIGAKGNRFFIHLFLLKIT